MEEKSNKETQNDHISVSKKKIKKIQQMNDAALYILGTKTKKSGRTLKVIW
jgi:hypothetical protein